MTEALLLLPQYSWDFSASIGIGQSCNLRQAFSSVLYYHAFILIYFEWLHYYTYNSA
jgi:hypothetical protein